MAIYAIQNEPVPVNTYRIVPTTGRQEGNGGKTIQETGDLAGKDSLSKNHSTWSDLQKINDSSNEVAQKRQTGDKILNGVEGSVDGMKAQLEKIIKNFPPYPPEDQERMKLLRNYAGFRKLIDELTLPPPEKSTVGGETSKVLSPADSVPGVSQPGEKAPGNLQA
jgi:hypothetical protein